MSEKYFKNIKKSNLQIDYDCYIDAKYNTKKLIKQTKMDFFYTKLTENIGKPKELRKSLKTLGLASIKSPLTNICLRTKDNVTNFDNKKMLTFSKSFFAHYLTIYLLICLPLLWDLVYLQFDNTTKKFFSYSKYKINFVSEETVLKLLKNLDQNKAAGMNNL